MRPHRINRAEIEIRVADEALAERLSARISALRDERIAPLLARVCDELSPGGRVDRIDALEVDLRDLSSERFEEELLQRLEPTLRSALRAALRHASSNGGAERSSLELLKAFARTGNVPWWAEAREPGLIERHLEALTAAAPMRVLELLRSFDGDETALARIARHAGAVLAPLLERAWPRSARDVVLAMTALAAAARAERRAGDGPRVECDPRGPEFSRARHAVLAVLARSTAGSARDAVEAVAEAFVARWPDSQAAPLATILIMGGLQALREGGANRQDPVSLHGASIDGSRAHAAALRAASGETRADDLFIATSGIDLDSLRGPSAAGRQATAEVGGPAVAQADLSHEPVLGGAAREPAFRTASDATRHAAPFVAESQHRFALPSATRAEAALAATDTHATGITPARAATAELRTPPMLEAPSRTRAAAIGAARRRVFESLEELHVEDAGLVILWPFLDRFFTRVDLLDDARRFRDEVAAMRAVVLLETLSNWDSQPDEQHLPLAKLLCGREPDSELTSEAITAEERAECDRLLGAVVDRAPVLGDIPVASFRAMFLQRPGVLEVDAGLWLLRVERRPQDEVFDRFPWSWGWVKLPWVARPLRVEW